MPEARLAKTRAAYDKKGNPNYRAGRAFEYARKKAWEEKGYTVIRAAGSHGPFDLVALRADDIVCIQCKKVQTLAAGKRLLKQFEEKPPFLVYTAPFKQCMEVKVERGDLLVRTI